MSTAGIAATMVAMQAGSTRMAMESTLIRQQHQSEQAVVDLLASAASTGAAAAPAPGTGLLVDKSA